MRRHAGVRLCQPVLSSKTECLPSSVKPPGWQRVDSWHLFIHSFFYHADSLQGKWIFVVKRQIGWSLISARIHSFINRKFLLKFLQL